VQVALLALQGKIIVSSDKVRTWPTTEPMCEDDTADHVQIAKMTSHVSPVYHNVRRVISMAKSRHAHQRQAATSAVSCQHSKVSCVASM